MEEDKYRIVCFMCNWAFCQDEMQIPSGVNVVRVMCIGRLDPAIILETFENGVDGVMLVGCKPHDCHYIDGNMLRKLLKLTGLETDRVKLLWYSPVEEKSFGYYAKKFLKEIKEIGFSPLRSGALKSLLVNVLAAKNAASDFRLRVLLGREKELTEGVNVYGEKLSAEEFDALLDEIVTEEFVRHKIHVLTKTQPLSVKALAEALEMKTANVLRHIVNMRRKNMITLDHVEGTTPLYRALEVK
jgi:coenzyme F420-reducing hydrogenase delta subunit